MSTDDLAPTIDDLAAELHDPRACTLNDLDLDDAPGEPMFHPANVSRMTALAITACCEPPGPWGKVVLEIMQSTAGCAASPGTVYPVLHDFDDDGVLGTTELVQRKHYQIADNAAADAILADYEQRLAWWLALCRQARESLDVDA